MNRKAKQEKIVKAYLFRGDDDYRKQQELAKLLQSLVVADFADFDLEQMEGDSATADRVITGLNVPAFSQGRRVVLVKHANKMPAEEQQKLASHLGKTPDSNCLVLVNPAAEKSEGRVKKGSEVVGELSRAVRKVGEVKEFGRMRANEAEAFARSMFAQAGKKIDAGAVKAFVQRVGTDSSVIVSEGQKLIDYAGDSDRISAQDIVTVTSETPEEKIFKLVDAIGARNQAGALKLLDELFETGDDPNADAPRTLATIARQFRLIWQARLLAEAGVRGFDKASVPADVKAMLPSDPNILDLVARQYWQRGRLNAQASAFTRTELARCFEVIARADKALKGIEGGIEDPQAVMELLVLELARNRRSRRAS